MGDNSKSFWIQQYQSVAFPDFSLYHQEQAINAPNASLLTICGITNKGKNSMRSVIFTN